MVPGRTHLVRFVCIYYALLSSYKFNNFFHNLYFVRNRRVVIRLNAQQQLLKLSHTWQLVPITLLEPRRPARDLLGEVVGTEAKEVV